MNSMAVSSTPNKRGNKRAKKSNNESDDNCKIGKNYVDGQVSLASSDHVLFMRRITWSQV